MIDPTITGCLINPLKNTPHGPKKRVTFNLMRSKSRVLVSVEGIKKPVLKIAQALQVANIGSHCNAIKQNSLSRSQPVLCAALKWSNAEI